MFTVSCGRGNSRPGIDKETSGRHRLTTSLQAHADPSLQWSSQRMDSVRKMKPRFFSGHRRNCSRQQHDSAHGICTERFPSLLFAGRRASGSDASHCGDCLPWSKSHRFVRRVPRRIASSHVFSNVHFPAVAFFSVYNIAFRKSSIE